MSLSEEVCRQIASTRVGLATEKQAQADIETALRERWGGAVRREERLSEKDRPDFMIETVAVEVKLKGAKMDIYRQLERYSAHDAVQSIILVTNQAMGLPAEIGGKPALYVSLGKAWL